MDGRIWINGGAAYGTDGNGLNLYLNSPSNNFGGVWFWYNKDNQTLFTTVPYAFAAGMNGQSQKLNMWGAGSNQKLDLCGNDQSLDGFGSSDGEITSATPATLHDIDNNKQFSWQATNRCVFTQAASFSFEGSKETRLEGVSTSTGTVQVTKGELILGTTGSWTNATTAIVKGGKMTIEHKGAFGKTTDLDLSSAGTLNLVYSGAMRVHALKLDDVELPMGVYGASGNTSVNSANRLASITGTGTINVIGDGLGLMLIFR